MLLTDPNREVRPHAGEADGVSTGAEFCDDGCGVPFWDDLRLLVADERLEREADDG
jgi:hypothetical protein